MTERVTVKVHYYVDIPFDGTIDLEDKNAILDYVDKQVEKTTCQHELFFDKDNIVYWNDVT